MFSKEIEKFILNKNYPTFNPKAVFFDMDGVIYDSMKSHASAWTRAMNESGLPFTDYDGYMNEGRTGASTIDGVFNKVHGRNSTDNEKQAIYSLKSKYFEAQSKTETMPFAFELLTKIKKQNIEIFLVTGSGQASLLGTLDKNFPGIFHEEKMVTAFDVKFGKPHPEPYLIALKKSNLNPWEVMVVENAPLGIESATTAGLLTIAVNTGPLDSKILIESGASFVFEEMKDLYENWNKIIIH